MCGMSAKAAASSSTAAWTISAAPVSASPSDSSAITAATHPNLASFIPTTPATLYTSAITASPSQSTRIQLRGPGGQAYDDGAWKKS